MFRITPAPTFRAGVELSVPGQPDLAVLQVTWRHKSRDAALDWAKRCRSATLAQVPELLLEVMADWHDVVDDRDQPVPLRADTLRDLIQRYAQCEARLLATYLDQLSAAREKNSRGPR